MIGLPGRSERKKRISGGWSARPKLFLPVGFVPEAKLKSEITEVQLQIVDRASSFSLYSFFSKFNHSVPQSFSTSVLNFLWFAEFIFFFCFAFAFPANVFYIVLLFVIVFFSLCFFHDLFLILFDMMKNNRNRKIVF